MQNYIVKVKNYNSCVISLLFINRKFVYYKSFLCTAIAFPKVEGQWQDFQPLTRRKIFNP